MSLNILVSSLNTGCRRLLWDDEIHPQGRCNAHTAAKVKLQRKRQAGLFSEFSGLFHVPDKTINEQQCAEADTQQ